MKLLKKNLSPEKHQFIVVIEVMVLMFLVMISYLFKILSISKFVTSSLKDSLSENSSRLGTASWILAVFSGIHSVSAFFAIRIAKKNLEIATKSQRNMSLTIYFSPFSKIKVRTAASRTQPRRKIDVDPDDLARYLNTKTVEIIKGTIIKGTIPKLRTDVIFSDVQKFFDELDENRLKEIMTIEGKEGEQLEKMDAEVEAGPNQVLEELFEKVIPKTCNVIAKEIADSYKNSRDNEVNLVPYIQPLLLPISFQSRQESEGFGAESEFEMLIRSYAPKSIIIYQPEGVEDLERDSVEYSEQLDEAVPSFETDGTYFYLGSAAGIPMLLDLIAIEKLGEFYKFRVKLSDFNRLRVKSLTYIILALLDKDNRQRDVAERNEVMKQLSEFNSELINQEFKSKLMFFERMHNNPHRNVNVLPKTLDVSHYTVMILGFVIASVIFLLLSKFKVI